MQTLGRGREGAGAVGLARPSEAGDGSWPLSSLSISLATLRPFQLSEGNGRVGRTVESGHVLVLLLRHGGLVLGTGTLAAGVIRSLPWCSWQTP